MGFRQGRPLADHRPPVDMDISGIDQLDAIRMDIGAEIGGAGPDRWLTIAFAADPRWAD